VPQNLAARRNYETVEDVNWLDHVPFDGYAGMLDGQGFLQCNVNGDAWLDGECDFVRTRRLVLGYTCSHTYREAENHDETTHP
jgi:hypothetical protein